MIRGKYNNKLLLHDQLKDYDIIFWDFDGVIKDSVELKKDIFIDLFAGQDERIIKKISNHHLENSGISRYEKIPIYLKWNNIHKSNLEKYCNRFSELSIDKVIKSNWIDGVKNFIKIESKLRINHLVSATPDFEIKEITKSLNIDKYFVSINGSPKSKKDHITEIILNSNSKCRAVLIGDGKNDMESAKDTNIDFFLKESKYSRKFIDHSIKVIFNKFED